MPMPMHMHMHMPMHMHRHMPIHMYRPSKVVAEREAWRLAAAQQLQLSTILPSFIVGPPRTPRTDGESLRNMRQAMSVPLP